MAGKAKVVLGTCLKEVDKYFKEAPDIEVCASVYYREAVKEAAIRYEPDAVVLSTELAGSEKSLMEVVYDLRALDKRVIFIEWAANSDTDLLQELLQVGIYDIVTMPVSLPEIRDKIHNPTPFSKAAAILEQRERPIREAPQEKRGKFKKVLGVITKKAEDQPDDAYSIEQETFEADTAKPDKSLVETDIEKAAVEGVFALGPGLPQGETLFNDWDAFFAAVQEKEPKMILLSSRLDDLDQKIASIRRKLALAPVPIIVVGKYDTEKAYSAGADECVHNINGDILSGIMARAERMQKLWAMAVKDELTGAFKRRFLDELLKEREEKYLKTGAPFTVALLDLDHFKSVNDTYGHSAGDAVLKEFARVITDNLRETDITARYGGEEFVIVFGYGTADCMAVLERLREKWGGTAVNLPDGSTIHSTFSAGMAVMGQHAEDIKGLMDAADRALYRAKEAGRNRVFEAEMDEETGTEESAPALDSGAELGDDKEMKPDEAFRYVIGPEETPDDKRESAKDKALQIAGLFIDGVTENGQKAPRGEAKVIAIGSPWMSAGASMLASAVSKYFAGKTAVSAVDCDLSGRGLGSRIGVSSSYLEIRDWRIRQLPVKHEGLDVYPLDPGSERETDKEQMDRTISVAMQGTSYVFLDVGSNPNSWWFQQAAAQAHVFIWVIKEDPLLMERARANWKRRPRLRCREALLLFGPGDPEQMEDLFMLPCVHLRTGDDKRGLKAVRKMLGAAVGGNNLRVLAVGFDKVPNIPDLVFDVFPNAKEAACWLPYHKPDAAVISTKLKDTALLEYDLQKEEIPVHRLSSLSAIAVRKQNT